MKSVGVSLTQVRKNNGVVSEKVPAFYHAQEIVVQVDVLMTDLENLFDT